MKDDCPFQQDYYLVGRECYDCNDIQVPLEKCLKKYDCEYKRVGRKLVNEGTWIKNERTGKKCLTMIGDMMKYDLSDTDQFPILTTKKMNIKPVIGELLGFIRGYDNAADFRSLNCKIWDANANENEQWLNNPNRKGEDDLGRIYGVQARDWRAPEGNSIDQLKNCVEKLKNGVDDRRLIVTHLNPAETHLMALFPCHLLYNFCLSSNDKLDLVLYQRSCDYPIGIPFNIASYALLLKLVAKITGLKAGTFTHMMGNIHIYEDQYELFLEQLERDVKPSPVLNIPNISSLEDLETWVTPDDFTISNYDPDPFIKYPFSV
jgi:thymidylate synthase